MKDCQKMLYFAPLETGPRPGRATMAGANFPTKGGGMFSQVSCPGGGHERTPSPFFILRQGTGCPRGCPAGPSTGASRGCWPRGTSTRCPGPCPGMPLQIRWEGGGGRRCGGGCGGGKVEGCQEGGQEGNPTLGRKWWASWVHQRGGGRVKSDLPVPHGRISPPLVAFDVLLTPILGSSFLGPEAHKGPTHRHRHS